MELLRLLAMFFILLLHANNTVFNYLTPETVLGNPRHALPFLGVESLANIGVDVFVLISGWFGIRARLRGGVNVLFQPVFYSVLFIGLCLVTGIGEPLHPKSLANVALFTKNYWYIKAYIGMYILSPVLNAFVEKANKRQFFAVLLLFFAFQGVYGCSDSAPDVFLGFSTITFCGLYLLARYIRLYSDRLRSVSGKTLALFFVTCTVLLTAFVYISYRVDGSGTMRRGMYAYCNPLVVAQSVSVLLLFNRMNFQSKIINWAAASCLSIYLIHENINLQNLYRDTAHTIYTYSNFLNSLALVICYILAVMVVSILFDQIRIFVWKKIEQRIPDISFSDLK